jgi:hypothetical protein
MLAPSATLVLSVSYGAEVRFQPRNTRNTPNESHLLFRVFGVFRGLKNDFFPRFNLFAATILR